MLAIRDDQFAWPCGVNAGFKRLEDGEANGCVQFDAITTAKLVAVGLTNDNKPARQVGVPRYLERNMVRFQIVFSPQKCFFDHGCVSFAQHYTAGGG